MDNPADFSVDLQKDFGDRDLHLDATTAKNNDAVGTKKREPDDGQSGFRREEVRRDEHAAD